MAACLACLSLALVMLKSVISRMALSLNSEAPGKNTNIQHVVWTNFSPWGRCFCLFVSRPEASLGPVLGLWLQTHLPDWAAASKWPSLYVGCMAGCPGLSLGRKLALIVAVTAWLTNNWFRTRCNILLLVLRPVFFFFFSPFSYFPTNKTGFWIWWLTVKRYCCSNKR